MRNLAIFAFLLLAVLCQGQTIHKLTVAKSVLPGRFQLQPSRLSQLQWIDNNSYSWVDGTALKKANVQKNTPDVVVQLHELNAVLLRNGMDTLKNFPFIKWNNPAELTFFYGTTYLSYNISGKSLKICKIPDNAENHEYLFNKQMAVFTVENNVNAVIEDKIVEITKDSDRNIVNGQIVSRNEFGIDKGIFVSPFANFIAFYRKDESKVASYPLVNINKRIACADTIKYPMAGESSEYVSLGVYNIAKNNTVFIENNPGNDQYLTNITWSPDEKSIFIQVLNREQNHLKLNQYDAQSGKLLLTLFEEKHPKYVEPLHDLLFNPVDVTQFIYQSKRDGYNHLYLYSTTGTLIKQLTTGKWEVTDLIGFSKDSKFVYFMATLDSPLERHCYAVNLKTLRITKLTGESGVHFCKFNNDFTFFIDWYSNRTTPMVIKLISTDLKKTSELHRSPNPLESYQMPATRLGTLKSADGAVDLYYHMVLPLNFDSTQKYPVIVYVYGGPHNQMITNSWLGGVGLWQYYMAEQGYIMFTLDNRGSEGRGFDFENVIHRQCGVIEMSDQMTGVKFLKSLSYVDTTRMGVHGWSYGGFMTLSLAVNNPDVFKVAVAGGPVIDWKYYEVMYGERYMDTPEENPDGYRNTSLLGRAKDLKAKTLIIHGAQDPTVVWQNSLLFIQECISNNIPVDYFVYPLAGHNMMGMERVHLYEKITTYFDDFLKK